MRNYISFIVITYNSEKYIRNCINSIYKKCNMLFEIIIVDNNSQDFTREIIKEEFKDVKLITSNQNKGYSWGVNTGVLQSNGDLIFLLNPDTEVINIRVKDVFKTFSNGHIGVIGPKVMNSKDNNRQFSARSFPTLKTGVFNNRSLLTRIIPSNRFSRQYLNPIINDDEAQYVDWVSGCAMLIKKDVFNLVGGFDKNFFLFYEDVDFCYRTSKAGYKVLYYPAIEIKHEIGISENVLNLKINYKRHHGMWVYYCKYFQRKYIFDFMVIFGIMCRFLITSIKILLNFKLENPGDDDNHYHSLSLY